MIFAWAREVKAGGTVAVVPRGAVPAWGAESKNTAVTGSVRLLVFFRKVILVHLSEHNLYFNVKNTNEAVAAYTGLPIPLYL